MVASKRFPWDLFRRLENENFEVVLKTYFPFFQRFLKTISQAFFFCSKSPPKFFQEFFWKSSLGSHKNCPTAFIGNNIRKRWYWNSYKVFFINSSNSDWSNPLEILLEILPKIPTEIPYNSCQKPLYLFLLKHFRGFLQTFLLGLLRKIRSSEFVQNYLRILLRNFFQGFLKTIL